MLRLEMTAVEIYLVMLSGAEHWIIHKLENVDFYLQDRMYFTDFHGHHQRLSQLLVTVVLHFLTVTHVSGETRHLFSGSNDSPYKLWSGDTNIRGYNTAAIGAG